MRRHVLLTSTRLWSSCGEVGKVGRYALTVGAWQLIATAVTFRGTDDLIGVRLASSQLLRRLAGLLSCLVSARLRLLLHVKLLRVSSCALPSTLAARRRTKTASIHPPTSSLSEGIAKRVSRTAYQAFSERCSISTGRRGP